MSINAKGDTFYCDYGSSVVAVRCGSDHEVVEQFDLNNSGKFLAENMCKLLNREANALKAQIAERDSRIRLWSARADELRQRCDHWYKLYRKFGKPVKCVAKGGTEKTGGDFNLTDELIRRRKADIEKAHKVVDAIRRCWLIEAELWDRLDRIERQNNLKIYDPLGFSTPYLNCKDCRESAGRCWPFRPPELWDEAALKKARQIEYVAKLLKERKVKL